MPHITLTDEQAVELRDVIGHELDYLGREIALAERNGDGDIDMFRRQQALMVDILHLLEIS